MAFLSLPTCSSSSQLDFFCVLFHIYFMLIVPSPRDVNSFTRTHAACVIPYLFQHTARAFNFNFSHVNFWGFFSLLHVYLSFFAHCTGFWLLCVIFFSYCFTSSQYESGVKIFKLKKKNSVLKVDLFLKISKLFQRPVIISNYVCHWKP